MATKGKLDGSTSCSRSNNLLRGQLLGHEAMQLQESIWPVDGLTLASGARFLGNLQLPGILLAPSAVMNKRRPIRPFDKTLLLTLISARAVAPCCNHRGLGGEMHMGPSSSLATKAKGLPSSDWDYPFAIVIAFWTSI